MRNNIRPLLAGLTAAAMSALCGGILTPAETLRSHVPAWVIWQELDEIQQLASETVCVRLKNGMLELSGTGFTYLPDSSWLVADCLFCDMDQDGDKEILLHVWKPGSFGQYQPFWRSADNKTLYSEHLFLYEWNPALPSRLEPKWMSSAMPVYGREVCADPDGLLSVRSPDGTETFWRWEGWGLVLQET